MRISCDVCDPCAVMIWPRQANTRTSHCVVLTFEKVVEINCHEGQSHHAALRFDKQRARARWDERLVVQGGAQALSICPSGCPITVARLEMVAVAGFLTMRICC